MNTDHLKCFGQQLGTLHCILCLYIGTGRWALLTRHAECTTGAVGQLRVVVEVEVHRGATDSVGSVEKTGRGPVDNHANWTRCRVFPSKKNKYV